MQSFTADSLVQLVRENQQTFIRENKILQNEKNSILRALAQFNLGKMHQLNSRITKFAKNKPQFEIDRVRIKAKQQAIIFFLRAYYNLTAQPRDLPSDITLEIIQTKLDLTKYHIIQIYKQLIREHVSMDFIKQELPEKHLSMFHNLVRSFEVSSETRILEQLSKNHQISPPPKVIASPVTTNSSSVFLSGFCAAVGIYFTGGMSLLYIGLGFFSGGIAGYLTGESVNYLSSECYKKTNIKRV